MRRRSTRQRNIERDWISFAYQLRLPPDMSLPEALQALRAYIKAALDAKQAAKKMSRQRLPHGLKVTWSWRNAPAKPLLNDSVERVVRDSRAGYLKLMLRRIERDLARLPRKEVRAADEAARKREEERRRRSEAAKAAWRRRKHLEQLRKRAQAARKAAKTRKRKVAASKKRSKK